MTNHYATGSHYGIMKLSRDLNHLNRLGKIISLEIDPNYVKTLENSTIEFIQGTPGFYFISGSIFINFVETDIEIISNLFEHIYFEYGSLDIIDSIIVHLSSKILGRDLQYVVELKPDQPLPRLVSVEDPSLYFGLLQSFRINWETSAPSH